MMIRRLFKPFDREQTRREIEEELRFHLELLTHEHLQQEMSLTEAKDAAYKRFGNVQQIENQCVEISRRNHFFGRAMTPLLIVVVLPGVLMRIYGTDLTFRHLGDLLIAIPILIRLLLYVRGLNPSSFLSKDETSSPLMLNDNTHSIRAYDQRMLTPVERLIADK